MKLKIRILAGLTAVSILLTTAGCTKIQYGDLSGTIATGEDSLPLVTDETTAKTLYDEPGVTLPDTVLEDYSYTMQAEEQGEALSLLDGFEGDGYIQLASGGYADYEIEVPVSQWYKITLGVCAAETTITVGAPVTAEETEASEEAEESEERTSDVYGALYIKDAVSFRSFSVDGVYLTEGLNTLRIEAVSGYAYLDYIKIENSSALADYTYSTPQGSINGNASVEVFSLMSYLSSLYGSKVLTGQYCTINSNMEIAAIYEATGRYPAIRGGDLAHYSRYYDGTDKDDNREIELSLDYAQRGGIVLLGWNWYSPAEDSHYLASETGFSLDDAYTILDIAALTPENLEQLYNDGKISAECLELTKDIDEIAAALAELQDENVPVLFNPLANAASGLYWWGNCQPESYIWLWRLLVDRMTQYHALNNLIWVWSGGSAALYPGDSYVDLLGDGIFADAPSSDSVRFLAASQFTPQYRGIALTETAFVPNPDTLYRDNALWLFFALWSGDTLVDSTGALSGQNDAETLVKAYRHQLTITLEELDF